MIANTPKSLYYAVIFTSLKTEGKGDEYLNTALLMGNLANQQSGFLGVESAREDVGITVSYWKDVESIKKWKSNTDHVLAQKQGQETWYSAYKVRICKVEREYGFEK